MKIRKLLVACVFSLCSAAVLAASSVVGSLVTQGSYTSPAVDPVLRKFFVINLATNTLDAIDADALQVAGSVALDARPIRVRIDAAHHRVYVLHDSSPGQITTIDGRTLAVIARTTIADKPSAIDMDFRRGEIYTIHDEATHTLTIFDTKTNTVAATLQLDAYVYGISVNRDTGKIYVPLYGRKEVAVISQASRSVVKRIPVNMYPLGAVAEERYGSVFVTGFPNLNSGTADQVAVLDSASDTVRSTTVLDVALPNVGRFNPVLSPVYGRAYVSTPAMGQVTLVDAGPSTFSRTIPIAGNPVVSLVNEDDGEVYVVDRAAGGDTITILDARLERVAGTLKPGIHAVGVLRLDNRLLIFGGDDAGNAVIAAATPQRIQPDTAIVTDFHHAGFDHYFHTASFEETRVLQDGVFGEAWRPTQQYWRVWKSPGPGRVPVCRFSSNAFGERSSHVYTPYAVECNGLRGGKTVWTYEETSYYVALPDATGACSPAYEELYRLYNNNQGGAPNHAYTSSRTKRDALKAKGWTAEGSGPQEVFACTPPLKGFVTSSPKRGAAAAQDTTTDSDQPSDSVTEQPGWVPGPGADPVLRDHPSDSVTERPGWVPGPGADPVRREHPSGSVTEQPGSVPGPGADPVLREHSTGPRRPGWIPGPGGDPVLRGGVMDRDGFINKPRVRP